MSVRDYHQASASTAAEFAKAAERSVENPSTPLSAGADWMYDVFGAIRSASGVRVNRKTVFTYGPVWRAVNLISRDAAKLPLTVHRYDADGAGKHRDASHPAYYLLRRKPNDEQTAYAFKLLVTAHALVEGNGYAYVSRRGNGRPDQLVPLLPDRTYPVRKNGVLWYVTTVNGEMRRLKPEDVIHIKGLGFDGLSGYPLYQFARDSFGLGMAAQKFGGKFFANNAEPSSVIEVPGTMGETAIKMLRESWDRMHGGLENAHRPAILEEGVTLRPYGSSAKQAQLIELLQYGAKEVANWFSMPVHKLGDTDTTSYASLEQENQAYLDDALDPWLVNWEEECWDKLLTEDEKLLETHSIDFDRLGLVRANLAERAGYYNLGVNGGWLSRDEVRARENLNPIPGDEGKTFLVPLNMAPAGETDDDTTDEGRASREKGSEFRVQGSGKENEHILAPSVVRPIVIDAARRMIRRLAVAARKAAKRPARFEDWIDSELAAEHRDTLIEVFGPVVDAVGAARGQQVGAQAVADELLDFARRDLLELRKAHAEEQIGGAIESHFAARELEIAQQLAVALLPEPPAPKEAA